MPGLNSDILGQLTTTIDERQASVGRAGGQPLLLLTAPRAGYGKTHLLGRLAAAAGGQVVLVPLAFRLEDEIGISAVAVRGLESMARAETPREGWTKLREACAGVCAALVRRLIESGALPCANADQVRACRMAIPWMFSTRAAAHVDLANGCGGMKRNCASQ